MREMIFERMATELVLVAKSTDVSIKTSGDVLYEDFIEFMLSNLQNIVVVKQKYVTCLFGKNEKNILSIEKQVGGIKITINAKWGSLKDDLKILRNVSKVGHWGAGDYQVKLTSSDKFTYLLRLVAQFY